MGVALVGFGELDHIDLRGRIAPRWVGCELVEAVEDPRQGPLVVFERLDQAQAAVPFGTVTQLLGVGELLLVDRPERRR